MLKNIKFIDFVWVKRNRRSYFQIVHQWRRSFGKVTKTIHDSIRYILGIALKFSHKFTQIKRFVKIRRIYFFFFEEIDIFYGIQYFKYDYLWHFLWMPCSHKASLLICGLLSTEHHVKSKNKIKIEMKRSATSVL